MCETLNVCTHASSSKLHRAMWYHIIRFFLRCKNIFVQRKRMIIFYVTIILQLWLAPCYTQALPQLLLRIYPWIRSGL